MEMDIYWICILGDAKWKVIYRFVRQLKNGVCPSAGSTNTVPRDVSREQSGSAVPGPSPKTEKADCTLKPEKRAEIVLGFYALDEHPL